MIEKKKNIKTWTDFLVADMYEGACNNVIKECAENNHPVSHTRKISKCDTVLQDSANSTFVENASEN